MAGSRAVTDDIDARGMRISIVAARFNATIVNGLIEGAQAELERCGAEVSSLRYVPGAWELPLGAQLVAEHEAPDAIVALGAVIRGETAHFEYISGECATGLSRVSLDLSLPVAFGVLTCDVQQQAVARSAPGADNKGAEAARAAIEMVALARALEA